MLEPDQFDEELLDLATTYGFQPRSMDLGRLGFQTEDAITSAGFTVLPANVREQVLRSDGAYNIRGYELSFGGSIYHDFLLLRQEGRNLLTTRAVTDPECVTAATHHAQVAGYAMIVDRVAETVYLPLTDRKSVLGLHDTVAESLRIGKEPSQAHALALRIAGKFAC